MSTFEEKYIKYKEKYIKLKKSINILGGSSKPGVFGKRNITKTASFIYCREPNTGVYYFALGRKVPYGSRKRLNPNHNSGAAGTDIKYHGKWGSFGGSINKNTSHRSNLFNAISEINEEAGIKFYSRNNVDASKYTGKQEQKHKILYLESYNEKTVPGVGLFLFKYRNCRTFFNHFPKFPNKRGGVKLVNGSKGEIDYVSSFSMKQLVEAQNKELKNNNNFMMSYVINSFNSFVLPHLSQTFKQKWVKKLIAIQDTKPRKVNPQPKYIEYIYRKSRRYK